MAADEARQRAETKLRWIAMQGQGTTTWRRWNGRELWPDEAAALLADLEEVEREWPASVKHFRRRAVAAERQVKELKRQING